MMKHERTGPSDNLTRVTGWPSSTVCVNSGTVNAPLCGSHNSGLNFPRRRTVASAWRSSKVGEEIYLSVVQHPMDVSQFP